MMSDAQDILFQSLPGKEGNIGEIRLNRPRTLNTLTTDMCRQLREQLFQWQNDNKIKAVIIRGEGGRAFCAGGDVKALYQNRNNLEPALDFFREEYSMNQAIFHFSKPYIAFLDGITMGGGAGISVHGSHRVATETLAFAMPETLIGFFPDVGAGYFLNQCPGKFGYYLGLTGDTIKASDAFYGNLINYIIKQNEIDSVIQSLCTTPFTSQDFEAVSAIINQYTMTPPPSDFFQRQTDIDHCFSCKTVEEMVTTLQSLNTAWGNKTAEILLKRSPTSLKVTTAHLNSAANQPFDVIMQVEFNIAKTFLHTHDFYEGVRAVLVDKDQKPQWRPASLVDVSDQQVQRFFA